MESEISKLKQEMELYRSSRQSDARLIDSLMKVNSDLLAKHGQIRTLVADPKPSIPVRSSAEVQNGTKTVHTGHANHGAGNISTIMPSRGTVPSSRRVYGVSNDDAYGQLVRGSPAEEASKRRQ